MCIFVSVYWHLGNIDLRSSQFKETDYLKMNVTNKTID